MNQPMAPCSPPRTNSRTQPGHEPCLDPAGDDEEDQGHEKHHADQAAPEPVDIFRPEELLEAGEVHALVQDLRLRDGLVERE